MATNPKSNESARVKKLIAGANQHLLNVPIVTINNVPYALPALLGLLASYADLFDGAQAAKVTYEDKLKVQHAQAPALRVIAAAFVAFVRASFGTSPQVLNDFGLSPHKARTPQTAEQKAQAAVKREATRAARHTLGKRQKAAIKGTAPAVPANAPPAPAPANGGQVKPGGQ